LPLTEFLAIAGYLEFLDNESWQILIGEGNVELTGRLSSLKDVSSLTPMNSLEILILRHLQHISLDHGENEPARFLL
jgi:hypothetical protein